ncbi:MAG: GNAT family N-acetyltransferase [Acidimicrobiales bacterium]
MGGLEVINVGAEQYRLGAWRGHPTVGYLVPLTPPERLSRIGLERSLGQLSARGYTEVLTAALTAREQQVFSQWGFTLYERLHLLQHDLRNLAPRPTIPARLNAAHRWDRPAVLEVDERAFEPMWRLDRPSLHEAISATPTTRFRAARQPRRSRDKRGGIIGYAVSGHAGDHGYLQRLAVDPEVQRSGIGAALVLDCLQWMRRAGVERVSVNTQEANVRAFALYERLGFIPVEPGLAVLRLEIGRS